MCLYYVYLIRGGENLWTVSLTLLRNNNKFSRWSNESNLTGKKREILSSSFYIIFPAKLEIKSVLSCRPGYQINSNCRQDDRIIRLVKFGKSGEKSRREILVVQGSLGRKYVTMGRRKRWKSISTCNGTRVHALAVIERTISSTTDLQYNSWHRRWPIHLSSMRLHANQRFEIVLGVPLPGHE